MKILIVSDTHRQNGNLCKVLAMVGDYIDMLIHLGDVEEDVRRLRAIDPDLPIRNVRGNCDFGSRSKAVDILTLGKAKILFCHGHTMFVGAGTDTLEAAAREAGCCVALYGHTHISDCRYKDGLYLMNPGSPAQPRDGKKSYGIIDITDTGILPYVVKLE